MALTFWTISWCFDLIITIMALERMIPKVIGKGDATVWTFESESTFRTENKIGKPPSIEKEETLFLISDIFLKGCIHLF